MSLLISLASKSNFRVALFAFPVIKMMTYACFGESAVVREIDQIFSIAKSAITHPYYCLLIT